jgi:hypothetical protein
MCENKTNSLEGNVYAKITKNSLRRHLHKKIYDKVKGFTQKSLLFPKKFYSIKIESFP